MSEVRIDPDIAEEAVRRLRLAETHFGIIDSRIVAALHWGQLFDELSDARMLMGELIDEVPALARMIEFKVEAMLQADSNFGMSAQYARWYSQARDQLTDGLNDEFHAGPDRDGTYSMSYRGGFDIDTRGVPGGRSLIENLLLTCHDGSLITEAASRLHRVSIEIANAAMRVAESDVRAAEIGHASKHHDVPVGFGDDGVLRVVLGCWVRWANGTVVGGCVGSSARWRVIRRRGGECRRVSMSGLLVVFGVVMGGCSMVSSIDPVDIDEVDDSKYELEFLRCEVESLEDTEAALGETPFAETRALRVVAEFRITNLDDIRRRFDIRAMLTDSVGVGAPFVPYDTNRLDPMEASVEQIRLPVIDEDVPPYSCSAEVWDSMVDIAFPDD